MVQTVDGGLQLELSEQVLDRSVTLARALLQSHAIEHVHATVGIANDAVLLEPAGHHVHGLPRGAEHHREKLLTELKCLAPGAVVRHQEPSAAARFHRVEGETCSGLHHQAHQSLTVALNALPKGQPAPLHPKTATGRATAVPPGTWTMDSLFDVAPPRNALMPTNPSAPMVATSTADPSSIIVVTDTTPPSGKTISWMCSLGRCRTSLLVSASVRRCGARRSKSSSGVATAVDCEGVCAGVGLHGASGARGRLSRNAFDYSTSGRLCHGLARADPGAFDTAGQTGAGRGPAATSICTTHPSKAESWPSRKSHVPNHRRHRSEQSRHVSGPADPKPLVDSPDDLTAKMAATQQLAAALPFNANKALEYDPEAAIRPEPGVSIEPADPIVGSSTVQERNGSDKVGSGGPVIGENKTNGPSIACEWIRVNGR